MTRATSLHRLDGAFQAFFRRVKSGEKPGFPRYRSHNRFNTLTFTAHDWYIDRKKLVLKIGKEPITFQMRNAIHREGEIKGLRIVKSAARWWAHFLVDIGPTPMVKESRNGVGIDVGLRTFATLSDGTQVEHPRFLQKSLDKLREDGQSVSRKKKGSQNRGKAKLVLARSHEKIANRRRNFIHQTVATLVKQYDGFAVEKLDVREMSNTESEPDGMTKKGARGLRRGIMDSGWTMFGTHLAAKAEEAGLPFVRVNPRGTSQRCSGCGSTVRKTLRDRTHCCVACGLVLDRDENAARNIKQLANDLGCRSATRDVRVKGAEVS